MITRKDQKTTNLPSFMAPYDGSNDLENASFSVFFKMSLLTFKMHFLQGMMGKI